MKLTYCYVRVSTLDQSVDAQREELERWVAAHEPDADAVLWESDHYTGKTLDRPGWNKIERAIDAGKVAKVVVWRLDRLGRTTYGLVRLFERFQQCGVVLVSLRDGVDLSTPAGRFFATTLAAAAAYEVEVKRERQAIGIARAKARGVYSRPRKPRKFKPRIPLDSLKAMLDAGLKPHRIAIMLGVGRETVSRYRKILQQRYPSWKPNTRPLPDSSPSPSESSSPGADGNSATSDLPANGGQPT